MGGRPPLLPSRSRDALGDLTDPVHHPASSLVVMVDMVAIIPADSDFATAESPTPARQDRVFQESLEQPVEQHPEK